MKTYKIKISGTDKKIRLALRSTCDDQIVSITPVSHGEPMTATGSTSLVIIEAHDDDDFANMMINTGRNLQKIS